MPPSWLYELPGIVSTLLGGFTLWMAVDAYRRRVDFFWIWLIVAVPGIGPLAYFIVVKLPDLRGRNQLPWFGPRQPSLTELRYQAEQVPTLTSQLALGERLVQVGQHAEAVPFLEQALKREPDHCRVLYYLAQCRRELGEPEQAIVLLRKVVARDRTWSDYAAWRLLIEVLVQTGDGPAALADSRELARITATLQHRCLLAERLIAENQSEEARQLLDQALEANRYAPPLIRRRNGRWVRQARILQQQLNDDRRVPSKG